ncbi:MAG: hydrolase [Patescibacteria group bacterium]|nr:hydrolase [Patescibacteria group bacterium]
MDTLYEDAETGCCPRFNPEPWDEKEHVWQDKLFLKDHVVSFMHIPLNFGKIMVKNAEKIKNADALLPEPLMLSDEKSPWGADVYIATSKDVPDAEMVKISGTFLTKVFEGPFKDIKKWMKEMDAFVKSRGKGTKKLYFYYTTCPRCAKHYGKNYVVLVAEI